MSGTGFHGSNDPTNSVKALKEDNDSTINVVSCIITMHRFLVSFLVTVSQRSVSGIAEDTLFTT